MVPVLVFLVVFLSALSAVAGWYALSYRARRRQRGILGRWPIRTVLLETLDPVFARTPFGPGIETEVQYVGQGGGIPGGTSDTEAWILAVLAKRARTMFEFGTCTGKTTYLWARNAAPAAEIVTLTLAPDQVDAYCSGAEDDARDVRAALKESVYDRFFYSGTSVEARIVQLFGDSKAFDETPYLGRFDLIFIDGSHAYSYVMGDSDKALRMCAPGGLILWHDYAGRRHSRGVYDALNALAKQLPLMHVKGTTLVAYRKPAA